MAAPVRLRGLGSQDQGGASVSLVHWLLEVTRTSVLVQKLRGGMALRPSVKVQ